MLRRLREAGYDLGGDNDITRIIDGDDDTAPGDALIHALIAAGGQDEEWLTHAQLTDAHVRVSADDYRAWTADLPDDLRASMVEAWGESPGRLFVNPRQARTRSCSRPFAPATSC